MMPLNLHYPPSKTSKANWVLDAIKASHSCNTEHVNADPNVIWGFGNGNLEKAKHWRQQGSSWLYTDMPYWNRWNGLNQDTCYWRIIENGIHPTTLIDRPSDRFMKNPVTLSPWRTSGSHVLVCPSSWAIDNFIGEENWAERTVESLSKITDRPIKIRNKICAGQGIPIQWDLKDAWVVITSSSIAAIDAIVAGIPVICHEINPVSSISSTSLTELESPLMGDRERLLNSLAYLQYTQSEIESGLHKNILNDRFL